MEAYFCLLIEGTKNLWKHSQKEKAQLHEDIEKEVSRLDALS
jgi:hypothetical protein